MTIQKRDALFNDVYTYSNIGFSVTTFIFGILSDKLGQVFQLDAKWRIGDAKLVTPEVNS